MTLAKKMSDTMLVRNAKSLWRLTKVVDNTGLTRREKLFGRFEIAYRILKLTTNVLTIKRIERDNTRQKNNLMLYNICLDDDLEPEEEDEPCTCDSCMEQEKQFLSNNLPVHEN